MSLELGHSTDSASPVCDLRTRLKQICTPRRNEVGEELKALLREMERVLKRGPRPKPQSADGEKPVDAARQADGTWPKCFIWSVLPSGSHYERVQICTPGDMNDFDFVLKCEPRFDFEVVYVGDKRLAQLKDVICPGMYVAILLTNPQQVPRHFSCESEGNVWLSPTSLKAFVVKCVELLKDEPPPPNMTRHEKFVQSVVKTIKIESVKPMCPAVTLKLKSGETVCSVDLVPAIQLHEWPRTAQSWNPQWLPADVVDRIKKREATTVRPSAAENTSTHPLAAGRKGAVKQKHTTKETANSDTSSSQESGIGSLDVSVTGTPSSSSGTGSGNKKRGSKKSTPAVAAATAKQSSVDSNLAVVLDIADGGDAPRKKSSTKKIAPAADDSTVTDDVNSCVESDAAPGRHSVSYIPCVVAKMHPSENSRVDNRLWRLSFSAAEKHIMRRAKLGDISVCHKDVLRLLKDDLREIKKLYAKAKKPGAKVFSFCSFYLKSIVLGLTEKLPKPESWAPDQLQDRYVAALRVIVDCLRQRKPSIEHYFIAGENIIALKELTSKEIAVLDAGFTERLNCALQPQPHTRGK